MTKFGKFVTAAAIGTLAAACAETDNTDERVVDETTYESPADIELPEVPVETPEVDTDGDGVIESEDMIEGGEEQPQDE